MFSGHDPGAEGQDHDQGGDEAGQNLAVVQGPGATAGVVVAVEAGLTRNLAQHHQDVGIMRGVEMTDPPPFKDRDSMTR